MLSRQFIWPPVVLRQKIVCTCEGSPPRRLSCPSSFVLLKIVHSKSQIVNHQTCLLACPRCRLLMWNPAQPPNHIARLAPRPAPTPAAKSERSWFCFSGIASRHGWLTQSIMSPGRYRWLIAAPINAAWERMSSFHMNEDFTMSHFLGSIRMYLIADFLIKIRGCRESPSDQVKGRVSSLQSRLQSMICTYLCWILPHVWHGH